MLKKFGYVLVCSVALVAMYPVVCILLAPENVAEVLDHLSVLGVIITVIAFCFGAYYAVLAVSAYAHHRDIEGFASQSKHSLSEIATHHKGIQEIRRELDELVNVANEAQEKCDLIRKQMETSVLDVFEQTDHLYVAMVSIVQSSANFPRNRRAKTIDGLNKWRARTRLSDPTVSDEDCEKHILTVRMYKDLKALPLLNRICMDESRSEKVRRLALLTINELDCADRR